MARLNMGCVPFKNEADVKEFISMNLILLDSGADTHVMRDANLVSNIYHSTCTIDTLGSTLTAELAGTLTVQGVTEDGLRTIPLPLSRVTLMPDAKLNVLSLDLLMQNDNVDGCIDPSKADRALGKRPWLTINGEKMMVVTHRRLSYLCVGHMQQSSKPPDSSRPFLRAEKAIYGFPESSHAWDLKLPETPLLLQLRPYQGGADLVPRLCRGGAGIVPRKD